MHQDAWETYSKVSLKATICGYMKKNIGDLVVSKE